MYREKKCVMAFEDYSRGGVMREREHSGYRDRGKNRDRGCTSIARHISQAMKIAPGRIKMGPYSLHVGNVIIQIDGR